MGSAPVDSNKFKWKLCRPLTIIGIQTHHRTVKDCCSNNFTCTFLSSYVFWYLKLGNLWIKDIYLGLCPGVYKTKHGRQPLDGGWCHFWHSLKCNYKGTQIEGTKAHFPATHSDKFAYFFLLSLSNNTGGTELQKQTTNNQTTMTANMIKSNLEKRELYVFWLKVPDISHFIHTQEAAEEQEMKWDYKTSKPGSSWPVSVTTIITSMIFPNTGDQILKSMNLCWAFQIHTSPLVSISCVNFWLRVPGPICTRT